MIIQECQAAEGQKNCCFSEWSCVFVGLQRKIINMYLSKKENVKIRGESTQFLYHYGLRTSCSLHIINTIIEILNKTFLHVTQLL